MKYILYKKWKNKKEKSLFCEKSAAAAEFDFKIFKCHNFKTFCSVLVAQTKSTTAKAGYKNIDNQQQIYYYIKNYSHVEWICEEFF